MIFKNAKDFRDFIDQKCPNLNEIYVKEIYNLGDNQYSDSPLFLYSGYSVIMAFLSEEGLNLNVYDKDFFIQHIRGGIFRESPDSENSYSFDFLKSKLINSFVQNLEIKENEDKTFDGIELIFKDGQHLHAEKSKIVSESMCSYLTD